MKVTTDRTSVSPMTGWTREHWESLADRLLAAVRTYASAGHARVTLPGPPGGYGTAVDGLEGFARTFLLAGFRLAGNDGADPAALPGLAEWYARGVATGTDPSSPERWVRPDEHSQAKVEAASIALILDMTRPWIWDRLEPAVRERVIGYLAGVVGDPGFPRCNWVWFRIVVETFLRSVGGPWSAEDIEADLAAHESFYRGGGWYSDGDERSFDHYGGWALHLYPVLWARMRGAADLAAARRGLDRDRLDRFLCDYVRLVGGDGSPLIQGRSLAYRFAAAAPLWAGALAGVESVRPGALRRAASGVVAHFTAHDAPGERDLLTLGWHHEWRRIAQSYSGPSSPYWAAKGMLGLALPADHPVWTAEEERLPVETGDDVWVADAPGWLVSGTASDGVVRVVNHGTDHAVAGSKDGDSPLYARLGYSTATAPLLSDEAWESPVDQTVALLDPDGRATHRAGMRTMAIDVVGEGAGRAAVGASVARARWVDVVPGQRDHGSGRTGDAVDAAAVTTVSVVRGAWEVRCVRVDPLPGAADPIDPALRLRIGGWPVAGDVEPATEVPTSGTVHARTAAVASELTAGDGFDLAGVQTDDDASPLGRHTATPWVAGPVAPGSWRAVAVGLHGVGVEPARMSDSRCPAFDLDEGTRRVRVTWPDGDRTEVELPRSPARNVPEPCTT